MLTGIAREQLGKILEFLPENDLRVMELRLVPGTPQSRSSSERIDSILSCASQPSDILQQQSMRKSVLRRYLWQNGINVTQETKFDYIPILLAMWEVRDDDFLKKYSAKRTKQASNSSEPSTKNKESDNISAPLPYPLATLPSSSSNSGFSNKEDTQQSFNKRKTAAPSDEVGIITDEIINFSTPSTSTNVANICVTPDIHIELESEIRDHSPSSSTESSKHFGVNIAASSTNVENKCVTPDTQTELHPKTDTQQSHLNKREREASPNKLSTTTENLENISSPSIEVENICVTPDIKTEPQAEITDHSPSIKVENICVTPDIKTEPQAEITVHSPSIKVENICVTPDIKTEPQTEITVHSSSSSMESSFSKADDTQQSRLNKAKNEPSADEVSITTEKLVNIPAPSTKVENICAIPGKNTELQIEITDNSPSSLIESGFPKADTQKSQLNKRKGETFPDEVSITSEKLVNISAPSTKVENISVSPDRKTELQVVITDNFPSSSSSASTNTGFSKADTQESWSNKSKIEASPDEISIIMENITNSSVPATEVENICVIPDIKTDLQAGITDQSPSTATKSGFPNADTQQSWFNKRRRESSDEVSITSEKLVNISASPAKADENCVAPDIQSQITDQSPSTPTKSGFSKADTQQSRFNKRRRESSDEVSITSEKLVNILASPTKAEKNCVTPDIQSEITDQSPSTPTKFGFSKADTQPSRLNKMRRDSFDEVSITSEKFVNISASSTKAEKNCVTRDKFQITDQSPSTPTKSGFIKADTQQSRFSKRRRDSSDEVSITSEKLVNISTSPMKAEKNCVTPDSQSEITDQSPLTPTKTGFSKADTQQSRFNKRRRESSDEVSITSEKLVNFSASPTKAEKNCVTHDTQSEITDQSSSSTPPKSSFSKGGTQQSLLNRRKRDSSPDEISIIMEKLTNTSVPATKIKNIFDI